MITHALWGLQQLGLTFELKGGTSLSKGYGTDPSLLGGYRYPQPLTQLALKTDPAFSFGLASSVVRNGPSSPSTSEFGPPRNRPAASR